MNSIPFQMSVLMVIYSACSYLCCVDDDGSIECNFVMDILRVAPLKLVTVPKLELVAAALPAKVSAAICKELEFNLSQVCFWIDLISLIDFFIFILLSRESGGGAMRRTNPDSLRSCLCFQVFRVNFLLTFLVCCLPNFTKQRYRKKPLFHRHGALFFNSSIKSGVLLEVAFN